MKMFEIEKPKAWYSSPWFIITIIVIIIAAVGVGGYLLLKGEGEEGEEEVGLTPHDPIHIYDNDDFTPMNGVVAGSGTIDDPYIIENWDISAETSIGVAIINTTAHFIIRNSYIHDGYRGEHDGSYWGYRGIFFDNVMNGKIDNNVVENNYHGIYLDSSHNNLISNNIVENNYHEGIYLDFVSDNNLVLNNVARNNSIYIRGGSGNLVSNNVAKGSRIILQSSSNNLIENCTLKNCGYAGIDLSWGSNNNVITNCTTENDNYGIRLDWGSDNNVITNCTIEKNRHIGIYLRRSDNNLIHHNNFVNNYYQAWDDGSNYWDNGYPSGGNYWSDYAGEDADVDGIGDTPYEISGDNNQDRYPLMNPKE